MEQGVEVIDKLVHLPDDFVFNISLPHHLITLLVHNLDLILHMQQQYSQLAWQYTHCWEASTVELISQCHPAHKTHHCIPLRAALKGSRLHVAVQLRWRALPAASSRTR